MSVVDCNLLLPFSEARAIVSTQLSTDAYFYCGTILCKQIYLRKIEKKFIESWRLRKKLKRVVLNIAPYIGVV